MKKAIYFIGGSFLQIPTIKFAKELELKVILTDTSPNPLGRKFADEFAQIDGGNADEHIKFAKKMAQKYQILNAYCGNDFGLISSTLVNKELKLYGNNLESLENCMNKSLANYFLSKKGIRVPKNNLLKSYESVDFRNITYPCIVKPVLGSGSVGVSYVSEKAKLIKAITEARKYSNDILIEEFIKGYHIDVSGFFAENIFFRGGILNRFFSPLPDRYPVWGCQPTNINKELEDSIYSLLQNAAEVLKVNNGPVKGDIIITSKGPVLIEITPRFHGDISTSFICPLIYKNNTVYEWFKWLLIKKEPTSLTLRNSYNYVGWMAIFPNKIGTFEKIDGLDDAKSLPGLLQIIERRVSGFKVSKITNNESLLGFIIAKGNSKKELKNNLDLAKQNLKIIMT